MVEKLKSIGAQTLMQTTFPEPKWYVEGLLGPGCYILASLPKMGKSLMALALGNAITQQQPFLGSFPTRQAGMCILAVEDRLRRIQSRLWEITDYAEDTLRLVERSEGLDTGLIEQLELDLKDYPDTGVYVIDTYAAVRTPGSDYSYQDDYDDFRMFADFADAHDICVLVCHHCRKAVSTESPFLAISGTTGITGAVAGMWVLHHDPKDPDLTVLSVTGKDVELSHFKLKLENYNWTMVEPYKPHELAMRSAPECVLVAVDYATYLSAPWVGFVGDLAQTLGITDMNTATFGKYLSQHRLLMEKMGVSYESKHTNKGNVATLKPLSPKQF